jgi:dihydrofolate synthase/folylpolyglutamate synthase
MVKNSSLAQQLNSTFDLNKESQIEGTLEHFFGAEKFKGLGLDHISKVFDTFKKEIKSRDIKLITIGGTNGKGSTALAAIELLRNQSNTNVAGWFSPHILSIRERFLYNDSYVEYDEISELIDVAKVECENFQLSYYEFLLYVFFKFALSRGELEYIVLEVGLGGRLDAVNVFDPDCSAITSISRDHQEFLGNSLKSILLEKIPISRSKRPLFTALESSFLQRVAAQYCEQNHVVYKDLFSCGVLAETDDYMERNQRLAYEIIKSFFPEIDQYEVIKSKLSLSHKGRAEEMTIRGGSFIFIGAHNLDGIRKMLKSRQSCGVNEGLETLIAFSARCDDDIRQMVGLIQDSPCLGQRVFTEFEHPRSLKNAQSKLVESSREGLKFEKSWRDYIDRRVAKESSTLVTGSYYFVGLVQRYLISIS